MANSTELTIQASIILVNFNGKKLLSPCMDAILAQRVPKHSFEVIFVDNASTDDSVAFVQKNYPQVQVIAVPKNIGFGRANNAGVRQAKGKYVVFLNTDTEVEKDWLSELIKVAESDSTIGAVSSRVYLYASKEKPLVQNAGIIIFKQGSARDRGAVVGESSETYELDSAFFDQQKDVHACCGVSMLVPKTVFEKVGGFDPRFFMYYEDVDLSIRLQRQNYRCIYAPKSKLWHHHAATSTAGSSFFLYHTERSRLLCVSKHFPVSTLWFNLFEYVGFIGIALIRALKFALNGRGSEAKLWFSRFLTRLGVLGSVTINLPSIGMEQLLDPTRKKARQLYEHYI